MEPLCIMNLFESNFNLVIGITFGRRIMTYQSKHNMIHCNQYGRPDRECTDVIFTKILHYHMSHYTKTALGSFENGAASCSDCIVMSLALCIYYIWRTIIPPINLWEKILYSIIHKFGTTPT